MYTYHVCTIFSMKRSGIEPRTSALVDSTIRPLLCNTVFTYNAESNTAFLTVQSSIKHKIENLRFAIP